MAQFHYVTLMMYLLRAFHLVVNRFIPAHFIANILPNLRPIVPLPWYLLKVKCGFDLVRGLMGLNRGEAKRCTYGTDRRRDCNDHMDICSP